MSYPTPDGGGSPSISTTTYTTPYPPTISANDSTTDSTSIRTTISPDTTLGSTTSPITSPPTTTSPRPPSTTTTTPWTTPSKEVTTSTPVPVTSVSSSNGVVRTYTSTSYSSYRTPTAVPSPTSESSTNVGAIVGGVVGGVAFIALIGIVAFILKKRRRNQRKAKEVYSDPSTGKEFNPHPFNNDDLNSYGSPTLTSDNMSQGGRPLGAAAAVATAAGAKPRPFVQPYNPGYDDQQSKLYTGSQSPPQSEQQQQYYEDYQGYQPSYTNNSNYNNGAYAQQDPTGQYPQQMQDTRQFAQQDTGLYAQQQQPQDGYYTHQPEPLMTVAASTTGTSSNGGRNVPDEVDYYAAAGNRGPTRHVPDEA